MRSKCANSISGLRPAPGIGQHPIRLEEPDRPAGAPICREVSEDFANDTGELEAVARAWRCQDNLRRLRVQPERVVGFFDIYRHLYPVSRDVLRGAAEQFQCWVKDQADKWSAPIIEAPKGRRDEFVDLYFKAAKPDQR